MSSGWRTLWADVLSNSSGNLEESEDIKSCFRLLLRNRNSALSRVLQLLHDQPVHHVRHVSWNFAGRESELAVQQLVDVAQRVGEGVAEPSDGGGRIGVIGQLVLETLFLLWRRWRRRIPSGEESNTTMRRTLQLIFIKTFFLL